MNVSTCRRNAAEHQTSDEFQSHGNRGTFLNILSKKISFKESSQRKRDLAVRSFRQRVEEVCFNNIVQLFRENELCLTAKSTIQILLVFNVHVPCGESHGSRWQQRVFSSAVVVWDLHGQVGHA